MDNLPENLRTSRYGIEKLRDHNYQNWSFQCSMLLAEKDVWEVVSGTHPRPLTVEEHETKFPEDKLTEAGRRKTQKEFDE